MNAFLRDLQTLGTTGKSNSYWEDETNSQSTTDIFFLKKTNHNSGT